MENLNKTFSQAVISGGEKRKSSSPLASNSKEPFLDDDIPDSVRVDISTQLERISGLNSVSYIPNVANQQQQKTTFKASSVASFGNNWDRGNTDLVQLEFLTINGQNFNINIARPEVIYVWGEVIGVDPSIIFGVSFKKPMNRGLMACIKLKKQVKIDDLFTKPDFSYNRGEAKTDGSFDIVTGRVLGLRTPPTRPDQSEQTQAPGFTRVNVYGLAFDIEKDGVERWLCKFGEILEFDDIMDRELPDLATGDVSVKMKLRKNIPCFLPMFGKKIRIAYRGMPLVCSNCFEIGHVRNGCANRRVDWLDYVKNIRATGRFEEELFGKWIGIMRANGQIEEYGHGNRMNRNEKQLEAIRENISQTTDVEQDQTQPQDIQTRTNPTNVDDNTSEDTNEDMDEQNDNHERRSQTSESRSIIGTIADYLLKK